MVTLAGHDVSTKFELLSSFRSLITGPDGTYQRAEITSS